MRAERAFLLAVLVGAALLASGACLAQEHGHGEPAAVHAAAAQDDTNAEAHGDAPGGSHEAAPADAHVADPHAPGADHGEATHGEAAHGGGHGGIPHIPNALTFIEKWVPEPVAARLAAAKDPIFSLLVAVILAVFFISLRSKLDPRRPGRMQMAVEMLLGGLYSLFGTIIGPSARRYTPFLGSLFLFIWCNNLLGLLPLGHAATSSFANTTFALGLITFFYVQSIALKENGLRGYLFHMAGSPRSGMEWGFSLLLFPLHVVGELIKPISLSLRLFGNIFGEETLVATMVLLGAGISFSLTDGVAFVPGLPLHFPFYFLGLLSSTIQALVFTLLATVYIALWLPHGQHGDEHGEAHHAHH